MLKKSLVMIFLLGFAIISFSLHAAEPYEYTNNPLYGPGRKYQPLSTVKRLSYENFRNIKMLQTSILNFGGGEAEIEKLVDQYADASALYFQNRIEEAADKFIENEKAILETAKKLAKKYKEDSEKLMSRGLKESIKISMKSSLKGEKENDAYEKFLRNAQFSIMKGTDFYDRYKDATNAPPLELIRSIYYFRRAKENLITMYRVSQVNDETKKTVYDEYKKDIDDYNNKVYSSREKKN